MIKLRTGDRATVYWDDAWKRSGLVYKSDIAGMTKPYPMRTTGWIFGLSKECVIIGAEMDRDEDCRDVHSIPRKYVTKIERLVVG